jgi:flagellar basal-body rod protein FlgG
MTDTLQAISRSLSADVKALATIGHNVANMNTPGYRGVRAIPAFDAAAGLRTALDQGDGVLAQTAQPFDVALRGPGFFVVERDGVLLLTRGGDFRIGADGMLQTSNGDRVQGMSGAIAMPGDDVRIDAAGDMWSGNQRIAQLQLVDVANAEKLRPAGAGAYRYDGELAAFDGEVVQGAIERANVDAADETIRLMAVTRHAESVQRAISMYDKTLDAGINRLGDN